jgi:fibrillarin-like pre-rRNA processing protein
MNNPKIVFSGVFEIGNRLATINMNRAKRVYGEQLIEHGGIEYRQWDAERSKIAAAIKKGVKEFHVESGSKVLYLGAAEGTTISHLSDIVGESGIIYGVDISARSMRKFLYLCEQRRNIIPILADASQPNTYLEYIPRFSVDVLCQDVSQREQANIFLKNARVYLKRNGWGYLSIKARSISSEKEVRSIVSEEAKKLENEFEILEIINLEPFEKEHAMVVCKKK